MMTAMNKCETCKYYHRQQISHLGENVGYCFYNAPSGQYEYKIMPVGLVTSPRPITFADHFCKEHTPKDDADQALKGMEK